MDAHLFRRIAAILAAHLHGARLERIHQPVPWVTAFSLFTAAGHKECLLLRADRKDPLLFTVEKNPFPNPAFPPAHVMRLRKYCEGRRLGNARLDWISRRIAFSVPGEHAESAGWLLLDLKTGPDFCPGLREDFGKEPTWPLRHEFTAAAPEQAQADADPLAPWRRYPVLTPALRRTLALLDDEEKAALLVDLEAGNGDLFFYTGETAPPLLCAWPLPPALRPGLGTERSVAADAPDMLTVLKAAQFPLLLAAAASVKQTETEKPEQAARKRRARLVAKLREEQNRLIALFALREDALLLQANLWRFAPDACPETITLDERVIALNPFLTVTENMQSLFKQSTRAARGLGMLEKRLAALDDPLQSDPVGTAKAGQKTASGQTTEKTAQSSHKGIQEWQSSDGFVLWQGRNAEGNRRVLKLARPFDLWFHAEDGPSAHLIIRRDHGEQVVPEQTLQEAAVLTGLKSRYKTDSKAPIMAALVKHVSPIKGGAPGTVRVQAVWRSFLVTLNPELEQTLRRVPKDEKKKN